MTSEETQEQAPVRLELSNVSTIHVTTGEQKVASLCLVLKDSPAIEDLLNNPLPIPKMIITDVVPSKDDPTKADIFFRNLTGEELIEASQQFILPPGSLEEVFGDLFRNITGGNHISAEVIEINPESVSQLLEEAHEILDNSELEEDGPLAELLENIESKIAISTEPSDNSNVVVQVSLAEAHLAQMLCVSTNAPAFVLTSESLLQETDDTNEGQNFWEDFIAILEFPYPDTSEYFDSTASLIQAVTGSFPLNLSMKDINSIRAHTLNDVLRMASGSEKGLIDTFGHINPVNKTVRNQEKETKPDHTDATNLLREDTINKLYEVTSPHVVAALIQEAPTTQQHMEDIQALDDLFQDSGLNEMFEGILEEEYARNELKLSRNPSHEEIVGFYSALITPDTFPDSMKGLVKKIQMPLLYAHNWAGETVDIEATATNAGEISVSKLLTVAVRFARLKVITETVDTKLVPLGLLLQGISFPGENNIWAFLEAVQILTSEKEGNLLFEELAVTGLPEEDNEEDIIPEEILSTPAATILHKVGHAFLEEGWEKEILLAKLEDNTVISTFVNNVFDVVAERTGEEEGEHERGKPCPVYQAGFTFFLTRPDPKKVAEELGTLIKVLAELNALKHTDYAVGSDEWNGYVESYIDALFAE